MNIQRALFLFLLTLITFNFSYSQNIPPCTNQTDPPGETACLATPICNFDGYCGRTLASYAANAWTELKDAICNETGGYLFGLCMGMTVENDSYLKFIATSTSVTFNVYVYDCHGSGSPAIQVVFFEAVNCSSGPVTLKYTNSNMPQQANAHSINVTGLTPGNIYYILIDGVSGEDCGYTFEAVDGVAAPSVEVAITPSSTICVGEQVNVSATGGSGNYTWSGATGLSATSGANVTITPPATVGTYNYTVNSTGGNDFCPDNSSKDFSIVVENCDNCTPPVLNIQSLSLCSVTSVDLNNGIGSGSQNATKTYYSSQANAQNATNPINSSVTASGTYWVRAENPSDATCFDVFEITVTIGSISYSVEITNTSCGQNDGQFVFTVTGGTNPIQYSIDGGVTTQTTPTFSGLSAGQYSINITDDAGCSTSGTENIINANGPNIISVNSTNPSCGDICDGTINVTVENGTQPYSFNWIHENNPLGINSGSLTDLCAGGYYLVVEDATGCTTASNVILEHTPLDDASFTFDNYCEGKQNGPKNIVTANGTFVFNPPVNDGAVIHPQTGVITNGQPGTTYSVEYTTSGICPDSEIHQVTVYAIPSVSFTANPSVTDILSPEVTFTNQTQNATSYSWNFGDNSPINHEKNPVHDYGANAGNYTVILTSSNELGCFDSASNVVIIQPVPVIYQVPNVFSPNGDNSNPYFQFVVQQNIEKIDLVIINRWGMEVFKSDDVNFQWDGTTMDGKPCSDGVYFYKMILFDGNGKRHQENGFVTLVR